jgi:multidrug efflux pump subunit AcrA (membrane-fusion protein)
MTVASASAFRIVAEVDEQDVAWLREGQRAQVLFGALPGEAVPLDVTRIAPVAAQVDGRNVFEVEATPAGGQAGLRPGMRGVVRIDVGERPLALDWWERATATLRRLSWRLLG